MKTCETCFFMAEKRDMYEHHTCARIIHGNGAAWHDDPGGVERAPAIVTDGSGYAARLCVLPTFGCVLHEPKETP